jgi:hypothetical protein
VTQQALTPKATYHLAKATRELGFCDDVDWVRETIEATMRTEPENGALARLHSSLFMCDDESERLRTGTDEDVIERYERFSSQLETAERGGGSESSLLSRAASFEMTALADCYYDARKRVAHQPSPESDANGVAALYRAAERGDPFALLSWMSIGPKNQAELSKFLVATPLDHFGNGITSSIAAQLHEYAISNLLTVRYLDTSTRSIVETMIEFRPDDPSLADHDARVLAAESPRDREDRL